MNNITYTYTLQGTTLQPKKRRRKRQTKPQPKGFLARLKEWKRKRTMKKLKDLALKEKLLAKQSKVAKLKAEIEKTRMGLAKQRLGLLRERQKTMSAMPSPFSLPSLPDPWSMMSQPKRTTRKRKRASKEKTIKISF